VRTRQIREREKLKERIPKLVRQESWRYKRVKEAWRRPTGVTNKMRRRQRGWPKAVSVGYKTPKQLRHLHPSGLREVSIDRAEDLERLDAKTCVARISHTVGERKRVAIVNRAKELQIRILNPGPAGKEEALKVEEPVVEESQAPAKQTQPEVTQGQVKEEAKP